MQTNRPYKLFAESCVTFLGPMLSYLKVELDFCTSCEAGCPWKAKTSYHSLSHIQEPPVVCGVAVCPTEGDNQYQVRVWGKMRKLKFLIGLFMALIEQRHLKEDRRCFSDVLFMFSLAITLFQAEWIDHLFHKVYFNLGALYKLCLCSS